jgi:hypothetical protein
LEGVLRSQDGLYEPLTLPEAHPLVRIEDSPRADLLEGVPKPTLWAEVARDPSEVSPWTLAEELPLTWHYLILLDTYS